MWRSLPSSHRLYNPRRALLECPMKLRYTAVDHFDNSLGEGQCAD